MYHLQFSLFTSVDLSYHLLLFPCSNISFIPFNPFCAVIIKYINIPICLKSKQCNFVDIVLCDFFLKTVHWEYIYANFIEKGN